MERLSKELNDDRKKSKVLNELERKAKEIENEKKLEEVKQWKLQKDLEARAAETERQKLQDIESRLEKQKFEEDAMRTKLLLQMQREEAAAKSFQISQRVISARSAPVSKESQLEQAERLRQKSEKLLHRKKELLEAKEIKKKLQEEKVDLLVKNSQPKLYAERDPNRLTDETSLQRARRIQLEDEKKLQAQNKGRDSGGRFSAPSLSGVRTTCENFAFVNSSSAVPTWRQGI